MTMKTRMIAAAALFLSAVTAPAVTPAAAAPANALEAAVTVEAMSRVEARRALRAYLRDKRGNLRIQKTWTKDGVLYARVKSMGGVRSATYAVDMETGKIKRVK